MKFTKGQLNDISRKLIVRIRIDPGCRSKQYSNAYHDGIVVMAKAYEKEILELQKHG